MKDVSKNIFGFLQKAMKNLNHLDFKILTCITFLSGYEKIFCDLTYISEQTGIKDKSKISSRLNALSRFGYISITRRQRQSNIYTINFSFVPDQKLEMEKRKNNIDKMISIKESNPIETLNKETSEIVIKELNNDQEFYNSVMKSNNERIEVYQKCLMLLFVINKVHSFNPDNFKAYLKKSFQNQSYTEYHKEVFESKEVLQTKIKNNVKHNFITESKQDRIIRNLQSAGKLLRNIS